MSPYYSVAKKRLLFHRVFVMFHLAEDYVLYADFCKRKGDLPKAKEKLNKAIEIFTECGVDGWVEKYEKELGEL